MTMIKLAVLMLMSFAMFGTASAQINAPVSEPSRPNIVLILADDLGYSDIGPFGSEINTPNLSALAENGIRFSNYHTAASCAPSRSMLLTGVDSHRAGVPNIPEAIPPEQITQTNYQGVLSKNVVTVATLLEDQGYHTVMAGKWHLGMEPDQLPSSRGFKRTITMADTGADNWEQRPYLPIYKKANWFADGKETTLPDDFYSSELLVDKTIEFIEEKQDKQPFFAYIPFQAVHIPVQSPKHFTDKYLDTYSDGWDALRKQRQSKAVALGHVPADSQMVKMQSTADWQSLDEEEKRYQSKRMAVYAGMVEHTDHEIGRVLDHLEEIGELDNTIVVVISDNGASGEGGPNGSVNENKFFNNIPDTMEENLRYLDVLGSEQTYNHYNVGWASAFNSPHKMWKRYAWNGGICDPLMVSWPAGIPARGEIRDQYCHVIDIAPTIYRLLGIEPPAEVKGYTQWPLEGMDVAETFTDGSAPSSRDTQFYSMLGSRGIYHRGWKANTVHPTIANWGNFSADRWELFNVAVDRSEVHDLSAEEPERLEELKSLWYHEAGKYKGFPLDDRSPVEVLTTPRPQLSPPRDRYVYRPGTAEVPEAAAVNVRNRSFKIAASATLDRSGAEGVLFSHGGRFGGHALFVKDNRLHYTYNWLGEEEQTISSDRDLPSGPVVLGVSFDKKGNDKQMSALGVVSLFIDDDQVAEGSIKTQPGKFMLGGEGLNIARDPGVPVSPSMYSSPFEFGGGTIDNVIVDVSGEPYVDLELEALAAMHRD